MRASSTTFFRNIKMWQFLIFQISSRPPPRILGASLMASDWSILNLFTSFWILRQIYNTWFLNFFYVDVSLKLAILHHTKYQRLEIFDQYFTLRCNISNVAKMLQRRLIWSKLASWRLFLLGKDLALRSKPTILICWTHIFPLYSTFKNATIL